MSTILAIYLIFIFILLIWWFFPVYKKYPVKKTILHKGFNLPDLKDSTLVNKNIAGGSFIGSRKENQDSGIIFSITLNSGIYNGLIIADGIGGAQFGSISSKIVTQAAFEFISKQTEIDVFTTVSQAFLAGVNSLRFYSLNNIKNDGFGTTLSIFLSSNTTGDSAFASIGDSAFFIQNRKGKVIFEINPDHSNFLCNYIDQDGISGIPLLEKIQIEKGSLIWLGTDGFKFNSNMLYLLKNELNLFNIQGGIDDLLAFLSDAKDENNNLIYNDNTTLLAYHFT